MKITLLVSATALLGRCLSARGEVVGLGGCGVCLRRGSSARGESGGQAGRAYLGLRRNHWLRTWSSTALARTGQLPCLSSRAPGT